MIAEDVSKIDVGGDFGAKVVEAEVRGVIFVVGGIHHPVNHVHAVVIESTQSGAERRRLIARSHNHVLRFFGLKSDIALGGRTLIIEVGECGHAERHVPRSRKAPAVGGAI